MLGENDYDADLKTKNARTFQFTEKVVSNEL